MIERLGLGVLHNLDPEFGHTVSVKALQLGMLPKKPTHTSARLATTVAGLSLPNPVGLAAGFDKNAEVIGPLLDQGFGFIEVGAATPLPQPGNPKPRLFRLKDQSASINRFGFNNQGMDVIATRLAARPKSGVVGINLGANKTSEDRAGDFARVLETCGPHVDFATVNVSSPNTEKLRDLQGKAALASLLQGVLDQRAKANLTLPIFLKIAPDLTDTDLDDIAEVAQKVGIDGIICTNTTLSREGITGPHAGEMGGLAGQPLFEAATRVLAKLSLRIDGKIPLIGVGGVGSAEQAYAKITAGASAVQLYTALVYSGFSLVPEIASGIERLLERDGFANVADAVGSKRGDWL